MDIISIYTMTVILDTILMHEMKVTSIFCAVTLCQILEANYVTIQTSDVIFKLNGDPMYLIHDRIFHNVLFHSLCNGKREYYNIRQCKMQGSVLLKPEPVQSSNKDNINPPSYPDNSSLITRPESLVTHCKQGSACFHQEIISNSKAEIF